MASLASLLGWEGLAGVSRLVFASLAPGLAMLAALRRPEQEGPLWTLGLALALSPALLAAATLLLVLAGLGSEVSSHGVVWGGFVCLLGLALLPAAERPRAERADGTFRTLTPALLCGLALLLLFAIVQVPVGVRVSYHGAFHAAVVAQLVAGGLPPDNPAMAGEALRYYWLFHWLLLVHHHLSGFSVLVTAPWLNGASLLIFYLAGWRVLSPTVGSGRAALGAVALGFAMNLFFPLFFLAGAAQGGLPPDFFWPFQLLGVGQLGGDPRLVTLLAKFLNLNGFPLGLALFAALLVELLPSPTRERPRGWIVFGLLVGTLAFHSAAALAAYGALSLAWVGARDASLWHRPAELVRASLPMVGIFVAALVVTSPYLLVALGGGSSLGEAGMRYRQSVAFNASGLLLAATPLVLLAILGLLRSRDEPRLRFLAIAACLLVAMGTLLHIPDGNQYKLLQLASFPSGALLFLLLAASGVRGQPWASWVFAAVVTLALASHGITAFAYAGSVMSARDGVVGDGAYLALAGEPGRNAALRWLRDVAPEAVAVTKPVKRGATETSAGSGRPVFVLESLPHFQGPGYRERYGLARRLFTPDSYAALPLAEMAAMLDRPLFVVLTRDVDPDGYDALLEKFERAPEILSEVFRHGDARVYSVRERAPLRR